MIGEKLRAVVEKVIPKRNGPPLLMIAAAQDWVCPHCGEIEDVYFIAQSIWPYCKTHKVSWLAGWDLSLPNEATEEQHRRYYDIGVNEFKHIYREETEAACDDDATELLDAHARRGAHDDETD
jgi:hypothetical protein